MRHTHLMAVSPLHLCSICACVRACTQHAATHTAHAYTQDVVPPCLSHTQHRRRRRSTAYVEEEEEEAPQGAPQQAPDEEEEDELAAEDENDPRVRAKRAKIGQLWDLLNSRPGGGAPASQPKPTPSAAPTAPPPTKKDPATSSSSLASLCKPSKAPPKARGSDEVCC